MRTNPTKPDLVTDSWYIGADGEAVSYSYNKPANLEFIDISFRLTRKHSRH